MNRLMHRNSRSNRRKPHMRGDEPDYTEFVILPKIVNPTCVGMNRKMELTSVLL